MTSDETKTMAEGVLTSTFQRPIRLGAGTNLAEREHVFRFEVLDGPAAAGPSVIVKRARTWPGVYDPASTDPSNPAWSLLNEWASLEFLADVAGDIELAPRFLGGDKQVGLLAMEDLGSGDRPDQLLLGSNAGAAEAAMIEIAARLGALHARTIGQQPAFDRIRDGLGPRNPRYDERILALTPSLHATVELLGLTPPPGLDTELAALTATLQHPGPFLAITHGDPCPDNWLRVDGRLRLLDFESMHFRHALLDGVYGRIHFPTCWCVNRSPAHLPPRMEAAYRAELRKGCREADDETLFGRAVVSACAFWTIGMCDWIVERRVWYEPAALMQHDRVWGIATVRQRALMRADIFARTTQEFGYLEALGATFAALAAKLRSVWPAEADAMPLYPAFREA